MLINFPNVVNIPYVNSYVHCTLGYKILIKFVKDYSVFVFILYYITLLSYINSPPFFYSILLVHGKVHQYFNNLFNYQFIKMSI